jgi:hypothetical protein
LTLRFVGHADKVFHTPSEPNCPVLFEAVAIAALPEASYGICYDAQVRSMAHWNRTIITQPRETLAIAAREPDVRGEMLSTAGFRLDVRQLQ